MTHKSIMAAVAARFTKDQQLAFSDASENLTKALEDGTRMFYEEPNDRRAAAIMQLEAAIDFIDAFEPSERPVTLPLSALLLALYDLNGGSDPPILKRTLARPGGRPPDTSSRKLTHLYAALMTELMMHIGLQRRPAAEAIAGILHQCGIALQRRGDDSVMNSDAVIKWREQVQKSVKQDPDSPPAILYRRNLKAWRQQLDQMRCDGAGDGELKDLVLGNLPLLLMECGESIDAAFAKRLLTKEI
jgi:hypothetical protein